MGPAEGPQATFRCERCFQVMPQGARRCPNCRNEVHHPWTAPLLMAAAIVLALALFGVLVLVKPPHEQTTNDSQPKNEQPTSAYPDAPNPLQP